MLFLYLTTLPQEKHLSLKEVFSRKNFYLKADFTFRKNLPCLLRNNQHQDPSILGKTLNFEGSIAPPKKKNWTLKQIILSDKLNFARLEIINFEDHLHFLKSIKFEGKFFQKTVILYTFRQINFKESIP